MQSILTNAVNAKRQERLKSSPQLMLGELIVKLEAVKNKKLPVVFDVGKHYPVGVDSWRGSYRELALEYRSERDKRTVAELLKILREAVGKTFVGYKGGDFLMGRATPVWVANYGDSMGFRKKENTAVVDVLEGKDKVIIKTKALEY